MLGNKTVIRLFLAILIIFWIVPVYAEVPLEKYEAVKKSQWFWWYIAGIGQGLAMANYDLVMKQRTDRTLSPLYCPPEKAGLNADNYLHILDNYLSQPMSEIIRAEQPTLPVEVALLSALKDAFPCK